MKTVEESLKDCIKNLGRKFEGDSELKAFQETSDLFDSLVEKGIVEKRGNHLLSTAETHLKSQVWFNSK